MNSLKPVDFRHLVRSGKHKQKHTSGCCSGYKQANTAMIHQNVADDYATFCKYNSGPMPLLYRSKPGETNSPLADDSDIRTDVPGYHVYKDGEMAKIEDNLTNYKWDEMVSFYIGCSYSFEENLINNKIPIRNTEQGKNVSMYKTTIPCYPVGPFQCNMVVSMRPIPENLLSLVTDVTCQCPDVHGGPVHIGCPDVILRSDISKPEFGDSVSLHEGDVPVFWGCGVTNSEAIKSAKSPLAMTHRPGFMFVSDVPQKFATDSRPESEKCVVVKYSTKGQRYSSLSKATEQVLNQLEEALLDDPGERGISHLQVLGDFTKSALALSHASSVAITTGFPCHPGHDPPDETDGLPGVFSIVGMLQALKKKVVLIVDRRGLEMNQRIMKKQFEAGILREQLEVIPYCDNEGNKHELIGSDGNPKYDVVMATERSGRAFDGRYYTMRAIDITDGIDQIDDLFEEATENKKVVTICVGDGGNELGMGKIADLVKKHIPCGETIACKTVADHVIATGISNWGCYGLACALYALRKCPVHDRYYRRAAGPETDVKKELNWALPTVQREEKNLEIVESEGIRDGRYPDQKMSVDGFEFYPKQANKIVQLRKIINE